MKNNSHNLMISKSILFIILFITSITSYAEKEVSLKDFIQSKREDAKVSAQNSENTKNIPKYSEKEKQTIEKKLNLIMAQPGQDHLKSEGAKTRDDEIKKNPEGAIDSIVKATDSARLVGFEGYKDLQMFKDADNYMKDPIRQLQLIKDQGCKEIENNKRKGFVKKEFKEIYNDEYEEIRSCEAPTTKFKCHKELQVSCKKTAECDYGGIVKGLLDKDMAFDIKNGFFTVGVDCDNCLSGTCATHERKVTFSMSQVHLVTNFRLVQVKFDDYIQIKLNGHIVYVGPDGGDFIEVRANWQGNVVFNGLVEKKCERGTNFIRNENVNLKPYLKEGKNTLEMRIIVSGNGEGWLKIEAKKLCCEKNDWTKKWVEYCEQSK